ncbi:hypothetical protein EST38_g8968 [Candolleomyces aberdarensis]|uniref:Reverse transcriptase domain-containing protein n=1 Tax=Candolleomyces aberdarensis TaxID=2316362 RepID=A0A4Q2DBB3_9AGAR|nr:hypothetical protein EST38_g8968 [Candolleomyces aberdarensis]
MPYSLPQHTEGSSIPLTASASGQWSNYPEAEWTGTAPTPPGNWGQDDASMSDVRSVLASRESTAAPSNEPKAHESASGTQAQRAVEATSFSSTDIAVALGTVAQWFSASAPPREGNEQAWSDVRAIELNINQILTTIRSGDWSPVTTMGSSRDDSYAVPPPIRTPKPSKGKGRAIPPPLLPPSSPLQDDMYMEGAEDNGSSPGRGEARPAAAQEDQLASRAHGASQAKAVNLVQLARAAPAASPQAEQTGRAKRSKAKPSFTTHGPSRNQVLVQSGSEQACPSTPFATVQREVNKALIQCDFTLQVQSIENAYGGWTLKTNGVAKPDEIDLIWGAIMNGIKDSNPWVGLPQSTSYLKIRGVPRFSDRKGTVLTTPDDVVRAMEGSPYKQWWQLTSAPRIVPESKASTSTTVFFNIWDSTKGTNGNTLIGKRILIFNQACTISAAAANPGVPLCTNCWVWGHPSESCRSRTHCKLCGGPHNEHEHRRCCGPCKGNVKATPPIPPTPQGAGCPHLSRCLACRQENCVVGSGKCPFWKNRFDRDWINAKYAELKHSSEYTIGPNSKEYWTDECTRALEEYRRDMSVENHKVFRSAVKTAKRKFFDERIEEIATTNKCPWDLMDWVKELKERKNPPCEAIQFNGEPCHELGNLWDTLHNTYNAASDRLVDTAILNELPTEPERAWPEFSLLELSQALEACLSRSAPGLDHITWRHLKQVLALPECADIIIALANGCIESGHWPKHFKESTLVIIPKPNKPSYSTPKAFRPIVLLNTLGKLIEKRISNRFQHNMIKYDLVDTNQKGEVRWCSTKDAGLFLTHLVCAGWANGLQTSVIAFDVAQFFPSINHQFLLAVLKKQGFHSKVTKFFGSYLVDRFTSYAWNRDTSDPRHADVGVDDGDIIVQSPEIATNCVMLRPAYGIVFDLFTGSGLALEHDKTKLFHFMRARTGFDRSLDLGYAPYTGNNALKPKTFWRYLGFYFDRKLVFKEHVCYYTTKALTTVMAMRMLGNSTWGLSLRKKHILYRACVFPIATYGHRLWYYKGAKVKGALKLLNSMQRKAALWITEALTEGHI